jgi:transcriptional regulator with XRE-family HTH domain
MQNTGIKIGFLREKYNISQREVGEALGLGQSGISQRSKKGQLLSLEEGASVRDWFSRRNRTLEKELQKDIQKVAKKIL